VPHELPGRRARERRANQRVRVRFPVSFTGKNTEGRAYARNISTTGALLEEAEPLLVAGGRIRLRFSLFPDSLPIEVTAEVVRETQHGFAVRFTEMDPRFRGVLRMAVTRAIATAAENEGEDDDEDRTLLDVTKL
jgi:hypothetical protein